MRVHSKKTLVKYWTKHADARLSLETWFERVTLSDWSGTQDILFDYPRSSIIGGSRVVFRLQGNKYRLIADINYQRKQVFIRFIGTHTEYDRIDSRTIKLW